MDCIVRGVAKSRTRLSDFCFHFCFGIIYILSFYLNIVDLQCGVSFRCSAE